MVTSLTHEQQVLNALNIKSFRNLSKEKIMEFVSMIPTMDKELAIAIVNQFPSYVEMAKWMVDQLTVTCDQVIQISGENYKIVLLAYRKVLDDLGVVLQRDDLSFEERDMISRRMIEIADKMAAITDESNSFMANIAKYKGYVIVFLSGIAAGILGVKARNRSLPHLQS